MSRRTGRTLLWQLGVTLVAVQVVVALVLAAFSISQLRRFQQAQIQGELERLGPLVADRLVPLIDDGGGGDRIDAEARSLAGVADIRVTVVREDGTVIADSHHEALEMDDHRFRAEIDEALGAGAGSSVRFSATLGTEMMYLARRVEMRDGSIAVVRISRPAAAINEAVMGVLRVIGPAALVSLLLTLGVIYLVSRRFTGTLRQLGRSASQFASGDLRHRIARPGSRELAGLSDALNDMAEQLSEQLALLQNQRAEQAAILGSMSGGVIALDLEQRVLSVNRSAERILDLDGRAARGRLLQEVAREAALHRFVDEALGSSVSTEMELTLTGGEHIRAVSESLVDADQEPIGLLILLDDVTELRRLETIRSDFAANVSHELRTPITNIKGYVETMQDVSLEDREQSRRFLSIIGRNAARLEAIIEDLLSLARLEQADTGMELPRDACDVASIAQSVVESRAEASREKRIAIRLDVESGLQAWGVAQLIEQAVGNLLSNALTYSGEDTTVTISGCAREDGMVQISVADEGPGIAQQHLPRLFERFYRVDQARSREAGGTGLGLAIVKHIALVLGGRAEVESTVGRGSVFRIILPRAVSAATV